ncbi:hypothetical protein [Nocardioides speluncae]|uniref:hypothetical protein n=1 Tax=Nocardioides speluncae TaxID=2670337 RepID=UPI000D6918F9|nr:hypothetical protein [Nocardioides speluncae]
MSEPAYDAQVARLLRDAGHEVVYAGEVATAAQTAAIAVQEDADAVVLVADDPAAAEELTAALAEYDAADVAVHVVTADQPFTVNDILTR